MDEFRKAGSPKLMLHYFPSILATLSLCIPGIVVEICSASYSLYPAGSGIIVILDHAWLREARQTNVVHGLPFGFCIA
jgi:hypothetical protein